MYRRQHEQLHGLLRPGTAGLETALNRFVKRIDVGVIAIVEKAVERIKCFCRRFIYNLHVEDEFAPAEESRATHLVAAWRKRHRECLVVQRNNVDEGLARRALRRP